MIKKTSIILIITVFILSGAIFFLKVQKTVQAEYEMNVHGFAWNPEIGWISFNYNDCTVSGGVYTGGPHIGCPDAGTAAFAYGVYINTEESTGYADKGDISGFAWNSLVGWISFNATDYCSGGSNAGRACGDSGDCPGGTCVNDSGVMGVNPEGTTEAPNFNETNGQVSGWAKILSLEENGWIKLNCDGDAFCGGTYGVTYDALSKNFSGWGWNSASMCSHDGSECAVNADCGIGNTCENEGGLGWFNFNCADLGSTCSNTGNLCTTDVDCENLAGACVSACSNSNYVVSGELNEPPSDIGADLSAPHWNRDLVCQTDDKDSLRAFLNWKFVDPDQWAYMESYRIVFYNETGGILWDTGRCADQFCHPLDTGACLADIRCKLDLFTGFDDVNYTNVNHANAYIKDGSTASYPLGSAELEYDTSYGWAVQMWDNQNGTSSLIRFDDSVAGHDMTTCSSLFPEDAYDCAYHNSVSSDPARTFTTFTRRFPNPDNFTWVSPNPAQEELIVFISRDFARFGNTSAPCTEAGCRWEWSTGNSEYVHFQTPSDASSTQVIFTDNNPANTKDVDLEVFDIVSQVPGYGPESQYSCGTSTELDVNEKLPVWIEAR